MLSYEIHTHIKAYNLITDLFDMTATSYFILIIIPTFSGLLYF